MAVSSNVSRHFDLAGHFFFAPVIHIDLEKATNIIISNNGESSLVIH
jgi:hypothetical protein